MATNENMWNVANRLHSQKDSDNPEVNHIVAGADEIFDDKKIMNQEDINATVDETLENQATRISALDNQNYKSYTATDQDSSVADIVPAADKALNTLYRIGCWDGTQYDPTCYSEYIWKDIPDSFVLMDVKQYGIDEVPTAGSENVVKSGGIANELALGAVYDVSAHNDGATFDSLSALLSDADINTLIPTAKRKGGMSIRFVLSSDNKYVQFRFMLSSFNASQFGNPANWQGVDTKPTPVSKNIAESGGVYGAIVDVTGDIVAEGEGENSSTENITIIDKSDVFIPKGSTVVIETEGIGTYVNFVRFIANSDFSTAVDISEPMYVNSFDYDITKVVVILSYSAYIATGNVSVGIRIKGIDEKLNEVKSDLTDINGEVVMLKENGFDQNVYTRDTATYKDDVAELYLCIPIPNTINTVYLRRYNANVRLETDTNVFTCVREASSITENGTVYRFDITETDNANDYPIGMTVGYVVFKNVGHFTTTNGSKNSSCLINKTRASKLYLQPTIQQYLSLISVNAKIKESDKNLFKKVPSGRNLCDPNDVTSGYYINRTNGKETSSSTEGVGCTGYIPVSKLGMYCNNGVASTKSGWAAYRLATQAEIEDDSVTKFTVSGLQYVYSHGSENKATSAKQYSYLNGDVYVRFSLSGLSNVMVSEGNSVTAYEPYVLKVVYDKQLMEEPVITTNNIEPTEFEYLGDNLCDPGDCILSDGIYIIGGNGCISGTSSACKGVTGFIPIDQRGLRCNNSYVAGTIIGYAYYDANYSYINGYYVDNPNNPEGCTNKYAAYIEGAKYVRFTLDSATDIMVSAGPDEREYVQFEGKREVISREILPDFASGETRTFLDGVEVVLPSEIVITKTDTLQLFYRSIVTAFNPYNFEVQCVCSVGTPYPRYFEYKPKDSLMTPKNYPLTVNVYDNDHRIVATGTTTIKVIANATSPVSAKNILLVGASTLQSGVIVDEVNRRFNLSTGDGTPYNPTGLGLNNINFVGRTTTPVTDVNQESQSGWAWKDYATSGRKLYRFFVVGQVGININPGDVYSGDGTLKFTVSDSDIDIDRTTGDGYFTCTYEGSGTQPASGTLTLYSGEGDATITYDSYQIDSRNPFWDDENQELDFTSYITEYCNGQLDILVSYLGINDIFKTYSVEDTIDNYVKPFIRALHTQSPSTKVILCTLHTPSPFGGMGTSYGASQESTYWKKCKKYFEYIEALKEIESDNEFSGYVSVCSSFQEFDSESLYPMSTTRTMCNRSQELGNVQTNGVHPTDDGKKAIADSIYHKITELL